MSRPFMFKRFTVIQERSAMKVGTDGVLLGAWCGIENSDRTALDIGAGTGLVALMVAQRGEHNPLNVDAVEIDADSAAEAAANAAHSPWAERVTVFRCALQDFAADYDRLHDFRAFASDADNRYDLIVSNPPFFTDSLLSPDPSRTTARHTVSLSYNELIQTASALLSAEGRFCVIIPHEQRDGFLRLALACGLLPKRLTSVLPKPEALPKRALIELVRQPYAPTLPHEDELLIELDERHCYSPEYKLLTSEFYLKF